MTGQEARDDERQCRFEFAPGVRCQMAAGHDEPYYPYLDYGQSGWYSDILSRGSDHVVHADPAPLPPREEWTGAERKNTVESWPVFRTAQAGDYPKHPEPEITDNDKEQPMTAGAELIAAERARQVSEEGYDAQHDVGHARDLAWAARCYTENVAMGMQGSLTVAPGATWRPGDPPLDFQDFPWPWHPSYWKPTGDPVRDLVKAGALIAAAIDSLQAER